MGGCARDLAEHGVNFDLRLSQVYQGVTSGGVDTNGEYGGKVDYRLDVDGHKLFGLWEGLFASLHAETRFGSDISANAGGFALPNAALLYPLPGDYHGTNINGLTLAQALFGGRVLVLGGKLNAFDLATGLFPEVSYEEEGFMNVNALVTALPWFRWVNLSMWGGAFEVLAKDGQVQGGLLALGTENVTRTWDVSDSFSDGVGGLAFWRFFYELDDKPGYVMFVFGGSTKEFASLDRSDWLVVPGEGLSDTEMKRPIDGAMYLSQVFWRADGDPKRNAWVLIGGTLADNDPSFSNFNVFIAIEATGPMAACKKDRMGFRTPPITKTRLSDAGRGKTITTAAQFG